MYTSLSSAKPHKTLYRFPCKRIVSQVTKKTTQEMKRLNPNWMKIIKQA